jgi:hypothetical protein
MSDKPGVVVPEIPPRPRPTTVMAIASFVLSLLTLIFLHFNLHVALWLSIAATAAAAVTAWMVYREDSSWSGRGTTKTPGIDPHGQKR